MNHPIEDKAREWFDLYIVKPFVSIGVADVVDILVVTILFYLIYLFTKERRAGKLVFGFATVALLAFLSDLFEMKATFSIFSTIATNIILVLFIIFQSEIRDMLDKIGTSVTNIRALRRSSGSVETKTIHAVVEAACRIAQNESDGALIVIERTTGLKDWEESGGVTLDAEISPELLTNIFVNKSPLHDGAVLIRNGRIVTAGCKLRLTSNQDAVKGLGTRHRAAVGISEDTDCIAVVVSEERHTISVANNGLLKRDYNPGGLKTLQTDEGLKSVQKKLTADLFLMLTSTNPAAVKGADGHKSAASVTADSKKNAEDGRDGGHDETVQS